MLTTTFPETTHDVFGFRFAEPGAAPHIWTITASLVAARREFDGRITLVIADPDGRPHRMLVAFPAPTDPIAADDALGARIALGRTAFVESFVNPSVEGCSLLYGKAELTLTLPERAGDGARCPMPRIVDFIALGGDAATPARRAGGERRCS
ncbi:MAG: hypothetical protein AB7R89_15695 [Dehalococcoidia bacterium]